MNYTTYDSNNFFIKKNSTYPILKYPLIQKLREQYDITDSMLEDCAVTFSMFSDDTGLYKIANSAGNLLINYDLINNPDEEKYTLTYKFNLSNTSKCGNYKGEFVIDFLSEEFACFKLKLPINSYINIIVSDSITKTTVI
jgi:hypothetical protein